MPTADALMEDGIFALASHVFLQTADAPACLGALERLLGTVRLEYLLLFLAFVRAAHYWTRVHPEIQFEDDIKQLLATHQALANCILDDPEASTDKITQSILDELPALRLKADASVCLPYQDSSDDAIVSKTLGCHHQLCRAALGYTAKSNRTAHSMIIPRDHLMRKQASRVRRPADHFDTVAQRWHYADIYDNFPSQMLQAKSSARIARISPTQVIERERFRRQTFNLRSFDSRVAAA
jgi:hypothetical protein